MSRSESRSGIVFYPDYPLKSSGGNESNAVLVAKNFGMLSHPGTKRPAGPNIARQLGMVTNARIDTEGNVTLGTAHAVPYEPAIAVELTDLYYPRGKYGAEHFLSPNKASQEREKELVNKLTTAAYEYLGVQGLADGELDSTLTDRRIDMIAPHRVPDMGLALSRAMVIARPSFHGEPGDRLVGTVWVRDSDKRGLYIEQQGSHDKPRLERGHPLQVIHGNRFIAQDHNITTTLATHSAEVYEELTVVTPSWDQRLLMTSSGFSYEAREKIIYDKHRATYKLPITQETADEIAHLQWAIDMEDETAAAERASKSSEDWSYEDHFHPNAAGNTIRDTDLHLITEHLDPLDDSNWRERLS